MKSVDAIRMTIMNKGNLLLCFHVSLHLGNPSSAKPPQSLLFPKIEKALALAKTPSIGTFPSKSLKDSQDILIR